MNLQSNDMKRNVAYKLKIGNILSGNPIIENGRIKNICINGKKVVRVNTIANVIEKYIQDGEKKYGSITLDDGSGQIKAKFFGDEVEKINDLIMGDTILLIGLVRMWNKELYLTAEIIKKKDPSFLLIRKMEVEADEPKTLDRTSLTNLKDKINQMVKEAESSGGLDIEKIIMELKEPPEIINQEIKKLLEDGTIYEPRPGKLRYLG